MSDDISQFMEDSSIRFNTQIEYQIFLYELLLELQKASDFFAVFSEIEEKVAALLRCEKVAVFRKGGDQHALGTRILADGESRNLNLAIGTSSIAGYAAMTKKAVVVNNVADDAELKAIDPMLRNDAALNSAMGLEIVSVLCVPIVFENVLVGVLVALNRIDGEFDSYDMKRARALAQMLGQHYNADLGMTDGPFDLLVERNRVSEQALADLKLRAMDSRISLAQMLTLEQQISIAEVGESLEKFYQVPFVEFDTAIELQPELLGRFSTNYLRSEGWVPLSADNKSVRVIVDDPSDARKIVEIERLFEGKNLQLNVGILENFIRFCDVGSVSTASGKNLQQLISSAANKGNEAVVDIVDGIVTDAYGRGASDIHIQTVGLDQPAVVLYRIDGDCQPAGHIPQELIEKVVARIKVMAGMDTVDRRKPQDGKCSVMAGGREIELRVSTLPNIYGTETTVLRLLTSAKLLQLSELSLSDDNLVSVRDILKAPHGIFLVVGPTGSGKTTTLHSILNHVNTLERVVWTVEDPVEIAQSSFQQVQVNHRIGLDFATVLRSILRADPDIIMIGEMRDQETTRIAVEASLTGHLVFSTLHTNSAPDTVARMIDMGVDPLSFAEALLGVLAQRLVRKLCVECKQPLGQNENEISMLKALYDHGHHFDEDFAGVEPKLFGPGGCDTCGGTGYRGRIAIHELLGNSEEVQELIFSRPKASQVAALASEQGMKTLLQDGISKIVSGQIDLPQLRKTLGV